MRAAARLEFPQCLTTFVVHAVSVEEAFTLGGGC
jgi:hypothetical protein